ncbi:MAG: AAA family ATPase [Gammaproteobacteria bacterium]|nr:MAG: AAA family ATPase [Gammaproteobacteria bacterium]
MNYKIGSEWRKWDLHVHTPMSYGYTGSWDQLITQIKKAKCNVIGINDYFSVAGYKKIKNEIDNGTLNIGDKYILPIVEMRMTDSVQNKYTKTNGITHFNFHIIFSDKINVDDIENFIKALKTEGTTIGGDYSDKKKLQSKKVSFSETLKLLNEDSKFKDNYLIWLPYDEYGGIDEIDPISDGWIKSDFINNSDILGSSNKKQIDFFLWKSIPKADGTPKFTQEQFEEWFEHKIPCIKGSDSHEYSYPIGKLKDKDSKPMEKFCWIKADPTFEGLKQIIYEPEERVYIGEKPPILNIVENNKTNYLKSLEINQANGNHTGDTWFKNISIPFNKELVAIIGNKGSGKSGIADILGLVGDTHTDSRHFSFLHRDKFLIGKLADNYKAQIIWESDGKSDEILLSADQKTESPESVRFIPQNYFEELTNEIEITKFQHVLEKIIFGYIPDAEKLEKSSFKELERYKTESVNRDIQAQKNKIQDINNEIINLEKKNHPDYLKKIQGLIGKIRIEIEAQEKLLKECPKRINPNDDGKKTEQQNNSIEKHNKELDKLKGELQIKESEKTSITSKIESLKQFKIKIKQQKQFLEEFLQNNSIEAEQYQLDIRKILKVKTDYSSIDKLISDSGKELVDIGTYFESYESIEEKNTQADNNSIIYKIRNLEGKIKVETDKLTGEEKAYQKNEQRKKSINEKIQELTGDAESPANETLSYYQKEEKFIGNDLIKLLETKRDSRIDVALEIFNKKNEIIELYNYFKKSVDNKISENKSLLKDYDIKIDSSFNLDAGFYDEFLGYIDKTKSGHFRGVGDGKNNIKIIVDENGFSDENSVRKLLERIIISLEDDDAEINEQVNKYKLDRFYDYVFSLDYIKPKYELKLGGKVLSQLSPGERGALLLIFYLMIDKEDIPLIIDQPEDNLDNESVYNMLSKFIKQAKKKRQIIMVTHNPNLAVGADAEQIIYVNIDKMNKNEFSFTSGSIENPKINQRIVQILEGTKPAFDKRKLKYQGK